MSIDMDLLRQCELFSALGEADLGESKTHIEYKKEDVQAATFPFLAQFSERTVAR